MASKWPFHLSKRTYERRISSSALCSRCIHLTSSASRPSIAPKPAVDVKHIRQHPEIHAQNCVDRNYKSQSDNPRLIITRFEQWKALQTQAQHIRKRSNEVQARISFARKSDDFSTQDHGRSDDKAVLLSEARLLKAEIGSIEERERKLVVEIENLALALPNLTSGETPRGFKPIVREFLNAGSPLSPSTHSHNEIGANLGILDFAGATTTSGWGWYFLKNEGAILEQALVQYALSVTLKHGFSVTSPPTMVYSHVAAACGFQPRDQGGEQQIYTVAQDDSIKAQGRPELCLAATAEIPFAGMRANAILKSSDLPIRVVGPSRCYRAEAGSRGTDTKGLYRVHEFTKVEMFGWTMPGDDATNLFDTMMSIQKEILTALGLRCRVLEQPSSDLGASATRKQDIEAFFPSRQAREGGWGELTSTSICTDYQSRRLATRVRIPSGKLVFPHTVNGTAIAVPRVIAAILENHWNEHESCVRIPEVLWPWMHGLKVIKRDHHQ